MCNVTDVPLFVVGFTDGGKICILYNKCRVVIANTCTDNSEASCSEEF